MLKADGNEMATVERIIGPRSAAAPPRAVLPRLIAALWAPAAVLLLLALTSIALVVTAHAYLQGAWGYVDNGDGYYLYAARRLAQGATLYRDVQGTQPPLVYLLGAAVFKLGGTLPTIRLVSAAMRALSTALVFVLGRQFFARRLTAALAALIYTLLPLGLVWDRSFDVNPPLTLVTLLALWPLLRLTPRATRIAGLLAALALFTKNLYLPVLAVTLAYLALRQRHLLVPYMQGLALGCAALGLALIRYAGLRGLHDAFLGQESSPFNVLWFVVSLRWVAVLEGGVVLVAMVGAVACMRQARRGRSSPRDFAPWFLAGSGAVLLATLKEGTAWPVFQLAEPAVALLAAYGATWALRMPGWMDRDTERAASCDHRLPAGPVQSQGAGFDVVRPTSDHSRRDFGYPRAGADRGRRLPLLLVVPLVLLVSLWGLAGSDLTTLEQNNEAAVTSIVALVRAHARPGTAILAPPYYALLSGTRLPGDAADTYILAQRLRRGDPWAQTVIRRVDTDLTVQRIPVVLTDLRIAALPPLMAALRVHYRPVYSDALPPALHVVVWLPRSRQRAAISSQ